jgi:hypothetical protein
VRVNITSVLEVANHQPGNQSNDELRTLLLGAPVNQVAGVESDAKKIGGNEAELGGADANDTNDGAVNSGHDPALPELLAYEHGGEHRQHTG